MAKQRRSKTPGRNAYALDVLRMFKKTSTRWKLEWLEEINRLTFRVLTPRERKKREELRQRYG